MDKSPSVGISKKDQSMARITVDPDIDEYDPCKPEYIVPATSQTTTSSQVAMLREQKCNLDAFLEVRRNKFSDFGALRHFDVLRHYENVSRDLGRELHDATNLLAEAMGQRSRGSHTSSGCWCEIVPNKKDFDDSESTVADSEDMNKSRALSISSDVDEVEKPSRELKVQLLSIPVRFSWEVHARKFCTAKPQIVSPTFEICEQTSCRITLKPTSAYIKGPVSFLKSSGCGCIEFELFKRGWLANVSRISLVVGQDANRQSLEYLGKTDSDFEHNSVCRLGEQVNFLSSINLDRRTVLISITVFMQMVSL
jgi:hypothetical protein